MNITVNKKEFLTLSKNVFDLVKKSTNNVYLIVNGELSFLIGISDDLIMKVALPNIKDRVNGECILSQKLNDYIKSLPTANDDSITIYNTEENPNEINILYENNTTKLPTITPTEWKEQFKQTAKFVSNNIITKLTINPNTLMQMYNMISYATTTNDYRYCLTGVLFELMDDRMRLVAGDGFRVSIAEMRFPTPPQATVGGNVIARCVLPKKLFVELKKIVKRATKEITISVSKTHVGLVFEDLTLNAKIIEDTYPDYTQKIPQLTQSYIAVNSTKWQEKMKLVDTLKIPYISITLQASQMELTAKGDNGEVQETVPCVYGGQPFTLGLDTKYIMEYLSTVKNLDLEMHCSDAVNPVLFKVAQSSLLEPLLDFTYVVSPVRI